MQQMKLKQLKRYQSETKLDRNDSEKLQCDPKTFAKDPKIALRYCKMILKLFPKYFRRTQLASSDPKLVLRASHMAPRRPKIALMVARMAQRRLQEAPMLDPKWVKR